ncbi:MAG: hypothetical protein N2482_00825 [Patescibacteria group bacterium]|nr:hypothetical protein [Patescibacteria group bacterium]
MENLEKESVVQNYDNNIKIEEKNPQVVFSWKAPLRPYKKRGKLILRFFLAVAFLLSVIIFFFGDQILIIPIWALLFLFYVLTITPPPEVENKITLFGVETAGITLRWEALSHFYFRKRFGFDVLTIVSQPPYFYHVYLVIPNETIKKKIIVFLLQHLIYQEKPDKSFTDKVVDLLLTLIPEEEDEASPQKKMVPTP